MTARHRLRFTAVLLTALATMMTTTWDGPASATTRRLGLTVVEEESIYDSSSVKSVTAHCPPGMHVVSAGVYHQGKGNVGVEQLIPSESSVTAQVYEDDSGYTGNWSVTARAVCAYPLPNQEITVSPPAHNDPDSYWKRGQAYCPDGTKLVGAGWSIDDGFGQARVTRVFPYLDSVSVWAEHDDGATAWDLTAYAICANIDGWEVVSDATPMTASRVSQSTIATCPSGKISIGGDSSSRGSTVWTRT